MLMIRFKRIGRKNQPSFKIVVTEKTKSSTGGRFVEEVGFYNPVTKEKVLKPERLKYWISQGAQPTPTVSNLLITEKVTEGEKTPKHKLPRRQPAEEAGKPEAQTAQPSAPEQQKTEEPIDK
jgi:small subunit ribosomal protein S16